MIISRNVATWLSNAIFFMRIEKLLHIPLFRAHKLYMATQRRRLVLVNSHPSIEWERPLPPNVSLVGRLSWLKRARLFPRFLSGFHPRKFPSIQDGESLIERSMVSLKKKTRDCGGVMRVSIHRPFFFLRSPKASLTRRTKCRSSPLSSWTVKSSGSVSCVQAGAPKRRKGSRATSTISDAILRRLSIILTFMHPWMFYLLRCRPRELRWPVITRAIKSMMGLRKDGDCFTPSTPPPCPPPSPITRTMPPPPPTVTQQASDARATALADVCRLLQHPEHLHRLPELRAECESKREVSETGEEVEEGAVGRDASAARLQRHPPSSLLPPSSQLNAARLASAVASHVDAARSGAALLDGAGRAVARLRECYAVGEEERGGWWRDGGGRWQADDPFPPSVSSPPQTIDRLCAESAALVHRPDTIAALARAASRARDAVAGARAVADLPAAAAAAEAALEGGASLAAVHEAVAVLEGTAAAARRALDGAEGAAAAAPPPPPPRRRGAPPPAPPPAPLTPYFARVEAAGRALEDRLWATVRALPALASPGGDARALAGAARALAVQDAVDAHLDAAAAAGATAATPTPAPKRWWARATRHVAASFADAFAPALAAASRLSTAPDTDAGVRALLDACQAAVEAVVAVADGAAPAFARGDELVAAAAAAAHSNIAHAIAAAAAAAPALANADILRVVAWCDAYSATLDGLGAGAALADGPALALAPLHAAYRARCKASLGEREGRGRGRGRGRDQAHTLPPSASPPPQPAGAATSSPPTSPPPPANAPTAASTRPAARISFAPRTTSWPPLPPRRTATSCSAWRRMSWG